MGFLSFARLIPGAGNALTFLRIFKGPCLILAIAALVVGGAAGGYAAHKVTRAFDRAEIAEAKQEVADWKAAAAQSGINAGIAIANIMQSAKELHDEQIQSNNAVAADIERLAAGVRNLSGYVSTLRLSPPSAGPARAVEGGEPRGACDVLQDLAAAFAKRADDNAADYNSLMKRWEDVVKLNEKTK